MVTLTALKDVEVETLIDSALLDKRYSSTFISFTITQGERAQATDYSIGENGGCREFV